MHFGESTSPASDSVRIVLRDHNALDKFLILSEADDPDNLKLPGGKFEPGESPAEAAIRELLEEVGLACDAEELDGPIELLNNDGVSRRFIFTKAVDAVSLQPTNEVARSLWVDELSVPEGKNKTHILAAVQATSNQGNND